MEDILKILKIFAKIAVMLSHYSQSKLAVLIGSKKLEIPKQTEPQHLSKRSVCVIVQYVENYNQLKKMSVRVYTKTQ